MSAHVTIGMVFLGVARVWLSATIGALTGAAINFMLPEHRKSGGYIIAGAMVSGALALALLL